MSPLLDLELRHMLDGDLSRVGGPYAGVDYAEPALTQHRTNLNW